MRSTPECGSPFPELPHSQHPLTMSIFNVMMNAARSSSEILHQDGRTPRTPHPVEQNYHFPGTGTRLLDAAAASPSRPVLPADFSLISPLPSLFSKGSVTGFSTQSSHADGLACKSPSSQIHSPPPNSNGIEKIRVAVSEVMMAIFPRGLPHPRGLFW